MFTGWKTHCVRQGGKSGYHCVKLKLSSAAELWRTMHNLSKSFPIWGTGSWAVSPPNIYLLLADDCPQDNYLSDTNVLRHICGPRESLLMESQGYWRWTPLAKARLVSVKEVWMELQQYLLYTVAQYEWVYELVWCSFLRRHPSFYGLSIESIICHLATQLPIYYLSISPYTFAPVGNSANLSNMCHLWSYCWSHYTLFFSEITLSRVILWPIQIC